MSQKLVYYAELLGRIKQRIRQGQTRAVLSASAEMTLTYWDIGRMILERQEREGWGASPILQQAVAKYVYSRGSSLRPEMLFICATL